MCIVLGFSISTVSGDLALLWPACSLSDAWAKGRNNRISKRATALKQQNVWEYAFCLIKLIAACSGRELAATPSAKILLRLQRGPCDELDTAQVQLGTCVSASFGITYNFADANNRKPHTALLCRQAEHLSCAADSCQARQEASAAAPISLSPPGGATSKRPEMQFLNNTAPFGLRSLLRV